MTTSIWQPRASVSRALAAWLSHKPSVRQGNSRRFGEQRHADGPTAVRREVSIASPCALAVGWGPRGTVAGHTRAPAPWSHEDLPPRPAPPHGTEPARADEVLVLRGQRAA